MKDTIQQNIKKLQSKVVNTAFIVFSILGFLSHTIAFIRALDLNFNVSFFINSFVLFAFITITLLRKLISLESKIYTFFILVLISVGVSMYSYGILASSKVYIIAIPVFISFILPLKKSILILMVFSLLYGTYAFLFASAYLKYSFDVSNYVTNPTIWIVDCIDIILTSLGLLFVGHYFIKAIFINYKKIESQNKEYRTINEDLRITKEKAEESDRLKTEFINNMSHEIRTPMNGILGFSAFLNDKNLTTEKRKHYVSIIQNSGNQLMRIIDDILEISKLGTKQVKVIENEIYLNDILLELFSVFDIKAKENKTPLYFKKGLSDTASLIFIDKTKLIKIVSNLLENAIKFTNTGFIEFGYKQINSELEIYVKDTGIGIRPESQNIIFDRFSQEEKELSKNVGGLGLGLSIAKGNTQLLDGKITLKSEKGKGATFFVTIPYKPVNSEAEINNLENNKNKIIEKKDKYTVLIVEDEEINCLFLETLLEDEVELNCKTIHAKNGQDAVDICKSSIEINFILMDLKMPVMNGFEATKLIKEFRPDLPIVAQTAYTTNNDKDKAFLAGCDDFISKPINKKLLYEIINKHLINKQPKALTSHY